ncbi:DinB/UmuC family translesion DNA polymerase [Streptomyces sp. NPDC002514]|uniref:DinB/UmuC family translesion DNA polymerase n=1 Tax=Streptomyces sp. NPDC001270 TaxID=3364554 RepID=UPI003695F930
MLERDCLDPAQHHRAVLGLAEQVGVLLRGEGQIAGSITLTVRCADHSSTTRTRTLQEPINPSAAHAAPALGLLTALGLQRARVRACALRADGRPSSRASAPISKRRCRHRRKRTTSPISP